MAALVATGLLAGVAAPPTAQSSYVGSGSDPAGDVTTSSPGHDIIGVAAAIDPRTGQMRAQIRLRGEPSADAPADINVFAGRRTATGCNGFPAIGFSTLDTVRGAQAVRLPSASAQPTVRSITKNGGMTPIQEFDATLPAFKGIAPDCVVARSAQWNDTAVVYDTAGPFTLSGVPGLIAELGKAPSSFKPGQTRTIRLVLRNPGHARTGRIRLSVRPARGLSVRYPRTVASFAGGKRKSVTLRVTLSSRAKTTTKLAVKATAPKKLTADADTRLYLTTSSSGGGGGGGGGDQSKLCYRYTWYPPYGELRPC